MAMSVGILGDSYVFRAPSYEARLLLGLSVLQTEDVFSDVTIQVEGVKFRGHRVVLAASSRYFRAMFVGQLSEHNKEEVALYGMTSMAFTSLLKFIYTGEIEITEENCTGLLAAADMLEIPEVVGGCSEFLQQQLSDDNCVGIYLFADFHSCEELKAKAEGYILNNFLKVCHCEEFTTLPKAKLIELLRSENLHIDSEVQVFNSAMDWIKHDLPNRKRDVFEVMEPIRFPLISEKKLDEVINFCDDLSLKIALKKIIQDFRPGGKVCVQLKVAKLKPYLMQPRRSARRSLFVIGGFWQGENGRWSDIVTVSSTEKFDLYYRRWTVLPSMLQQRSDHGVVQLDGLIYALGGECSSLIFDSAECFNPFTEKWSSISHMISPRSSMGVCSVDGRIYVLGGWVGAEIGTTVESYDPLEDCWCVAGRVVTPRYGMAVVAHEGLIYVLGGMNDTCEELRTLESYNPVTREWTRLCDMRVRRAFVGAAVLDGHIYAVGGQEFDAALNFVERYSVEKNCWTDVAPMCARRSGACVCAVNGLIYVIGGDNPRSGFVPSHTLNTVECYDPQTGSWTEVDRMMTPRCHGGVAVL